MSGRFIIATDSATQQQQDAITLFFKNDPAGYWHWFKDCWLICDNGKKWSATTLRDKITELAPGLSCVVFRVDDKSAWAGFGQKNIFEWMHSNWTK